MPCWCSGFAPGAFLRLIVFAFRRGDPRRAELLAELHVVPRLERPFWVFEQLEVALFEGIWERIRLNLMAWIGVIPPGMAKVEWTKAHRIRSFQFTLKHRVLIKLKRVETNGGPGLPFDFERLWERGATEISATWRKKDVG